MSIALIEKKMIETLLRWFEHVQRRLPEAPMKKVDQMTFSLMKRCKRRLKKTLRDIIKRDL